MKKIYITGIAGLLGNTIAQELKSKYQICGADAVKVNMEAVSYDCIDLTNYELLEKSIVSSHPDVVVHTVAVVNGDLCETDKELAKKINVNLTKKIREICTENDIKMIYISTDSVFDGNDDSLYTEDDEVNPPNNYAQTKLNGEIETLINENNLVLRTNIYGINLQNKYSFGEWILYSLLADKEINMFDDIYFSPILTNDLADIIDRCIEKNLKGLFHACGTGVISKYDFGMYLKKKFGISTGTINKTNSSIMNFKAKRPKNMGMSNEKIKRELGITIRNAYESLDYFYELCIQRGIVSND